MPRFILMEVSKPPLSPKRIYNESKDRLNLMAGYGIDHNIILYDTDDTVINEYLKEDGVVSKSIIKIRVKRQVYDTKVIYEYIRSRYENTETPLPKYNKIKDYISRKIYDKFTDRYLYSTDSMFLNNSPSNKYRNNYYSYLYIGGNYDISVATSLEKISKYLVTIEGKKPIKNVIKEYYAMCCDTIYIEDNYLDIMPYEYSKYLPKKDAIIDKLYKVKALEAIGLTDEISSRWVEGKSVLATIIGDEENAIEDIIFPPASSNYGISGSYGDDDYGDNNE